MKSPLVDVIIPVHSDQRPIARAIASVLTDCVAEVRITVMCHNISAEVIKGVAGPWATDPRVRFLEHADDFPSPSGPVNAGLDAATAEFTALLDSDDEFEPGAIDAWIAVQRRDDADAVIALERIGNGHSTKTPPVRFRRARRLDGVKDRLAYRTRQCGLVRRTTFAHVRMTPGLRTGEDAIQGASLWFSNARISIARRAPGYVIHVDTADRTSASAKPAAESLLFLDAVLAPRFVANLSPAQREAFAIKLLRTTVIGLLRTSLLSDNPDADIASLAEGTRRILAIAPTAVTIMSRRQARIMAELLGEARADVLATDCTHLTDFRRLDNLLPGSLRRLFHREAPLRFLAATALTR